MAAKQLGPLVWREEHLRLAVEAACVALWSWNVDDNEFAMDERAFELWGLEWANTVSFEQLSAHIHPADRDRVRAAFIATRSLIGSYEIDFRIMIGDEIRWISARGRGGDHGIVDRVMFGVFPDVTGRKQAEEGSELLAGEMSHRVKNLLAIATGLTELTARNATSVEEMSGELGALSCAEGFVDVSNRTDGENIELIWAETGGPIIPESPQLTGFGSRLVSRSVASQLSGELTYDWRESGLVVTVRMRSDRLAA